MAQAALDSLPNITKKTVKSYQKVSSTDMLEDRGLTTETQKGLKIADVTDSRHLVPPLGELFTDAWGLV